MHLVWQADVKRRLKQVVKLRTWLNRLKIGSNDKSCDDVYEFSRFITSGLFRDRF
jgi:hypothetical protein